MIQNAQPMDCERYDKIALNLLYEELDELTAAAARRHLHHCTRCKNLSSGMHATKELADLPLVDPPEELRGRILQAERLAHKELSLRQRLERSISVIAGYAMRPQAAMAAVLLLMVSVSLVFLRARPTDHDQVSVTERGVPGLDVDVMPRHSIVMEPLPPEPTATSPSAERLGAPPPSRMAESASAPHDVRGRDAAADAKGVAADEAEAEAGGPVDFDQALASYHAGRYAEAEQQFSRVAAAGGSQAPRAALHEAHAARNGSGCQRAAGLYDTVVTRYAGSPIADEASWHAASCYRAVGQDERAAAHYRNLTSRPGYAERATQALAALDADAAPANTETTVASRKASSPARAESAAAATAARPASPAPAGAAPAASAEGKPTADDER